MTDCYTAVPEGTEGDSEPSSVPYDWTQSAVLALGTSNWVQRTDAAGTSDLTNTGIAASTENETLYYNIGNNAGVELPSTGGAGTNFIYLLGSVLMMLSGALLLRRRRNF